MEKNLNTNLKNENLFNDRDFLSHLNFEVNYASIVKGGHTPHYFIEQKQKRLINDVNILTSKEQQEIAYNLFINKN